MAQRHMELNAGWQCRQAGKVKESGLVISQPSYKLKDWMAAVVPGTVLTTLLYNHRIPDPFFGMNNKHIPDIYNTGREYYTYWFVKEFRLADLTPGQQVWLHLRGVNYGCDLYLNGHKLNRKTHFGMFLRQEYNITSYLNKSHNRLAIIVYPPDPVGNAARGQGGDGTIARNVGSQYTAGWDWIQPIHDRNTGIWDKVWLATTGPVELRYPHIITVVPGIRYPRAPQKAVSIRVSANLHNAAKTPVTGILEYTLGGHTVSRQVTLPAGQATTVQMPDLQLDDPKLWWPNGYGKQNLYHVMLRFQVNGRSVSDSQQVSFGIRQITTHWDPFTRSMKIFV
ncbi:MAG: glycosyl hydrolase 2 galactose-binding domain-containing protein, partial [Candidatus Saccharimonadales bacterium]